jgi:tetraacyldisaccharide 4'-kinase
MPVRAAIEAIIQSPPGAVHTHLGRLLGVLSRVYVLGWRLQGARRRRRGVPARLPCPVISIGNITVGGTGKTPMTALLAAWLRADGWRPAVLSRGYRGAAEKRGGLVSDGRCLGLSAAAAGDEPWLLAHRLLPLGVPVAVGRDRVTVGRRLLSACDANLILLDDGFQHRRLDRDVDLVLLDAGAPFGNGYLLPRGPLREPLEGLERADGFILTRSREPARDKAELQALLGGLPGGVALAARPIFTVGYGATVYRPEAPVADAIRPQGSTNERGEGTLSLDGLEIAGFSGLARNDWFRASLEREGARILAWREFPDHHTYSPRDLAGAAALAAEAGAKALVTTEKDLARIGTAMRLPSGVELLVAGLRLRVDDAEGLRALIRERLAACKSGLNTASAGLIVDALPGSAVGCRAAASDRKEG